MRSEDKPPLVLVRLNDEQIKKAKAVNGPRKRITHTLLCGSYGQIFGTEKQCRKYYDAWRQIFPQIFSTAYENDNREISDYETTTELVMKLIYASEPHLIEDDDSTTLTKPAVRRNPGNGKHAICQFIFGIACA